MTVPELTSPVVVLGEYSFSKTRPSPQLRKRLTRPNLVVAGIGGSGKSLVLRRMLALHKTGIQDPHVDADVVPSVGVDINTFPIDKKRNMVCKEVGGTMMPLWPMYMKDCAGLVYVVDASDSFQLGASAAALRHILSLPAIRGKPVLLALNKSDAPCVVSMEDVEATFDISSLREEIGDAMVVLKTSALSGANIDDVLSWVRGIYGL